MIGIMEAEKIEAIMREQAKPVRQCVDFVEIEQQVEDTVAQSMLPRPQSVMHDRAEVEGGMKPRHQATSGAGMAGRIA
jgi:hypothetical protein